MSTVESDNRGGLTEKGSLLENIVYGFSSQLKQFSNWNFNLLQGEGTDENSVHNLEEVKNGRCTCSTILHYDKEGKEFVDFIASYPLTK